MVGSDDSFPLEMVPFVWEHSFFFLGGVLSKVDIAAFSEETSGETSSKVFCFLKLTFLFRFVG